MKRLHIKLIPYFICSLFLAFYSSQLLADEDTSFNLNLNVGTGFFLSDVRGSYKNIDLGFHVGDGVYAGGRLWTKAGVYAGFGALVGAKSVGPYGILGYEWRFLKFFALNAEYFGQSNFKGNSQAMGQLGIGVGF